MILLLLRYNHSKTLLKSNKELFLKFQVPIKESLEVILVEKIWIRRNSHRTLRNLVLQDLLEIMQIQDLIHISRANSC